MSTLAARVAVGALALAAAWGLFVILVGDWNSTEAATAQSKRAAAATRIVVRDGEAVGGVARLEYRRGELVEFTVQSDEADEVHVHGFDLMSEVDENGSVHFSFPATIEGVFEVELEFSGIEIAELRVGP